MPLLRAAIALLVSDMASESRLNPHWLWISLRSVFMDSPSQPHPNHFRMFVIIILFTGINQYSLFFIVKQVLFPKLSSHFFFY